LITLTTNAHIRLDEHARWRKKDHWIIKIYPMVTRLTSQARRASTPARMKRQNVQNTPVLFHPAAAGIR
jgi:hypothetical protein